MKQMIHKPNTMRGHHITNKMSGCGMGSVLLDKGGAGGASSYSSLESYKRTTGEGMKVKPAVMPREFSEKYGRGIGGQIEAKLQSLQLKDDKRRKPQNIKFSL